MIPFMQGIMCCASYIYVVYCTYCTNTMTSPSKPKIKLVFNTSGLHFCKTILNELRGNCEIILSPLVATHFRQTTGYSIEELTDSDKDFVYQMIRRHLNKELATNYKRGRKTNHAGEFESIALAKRLETYVVIHDRQAGQWAKLERVRSLHPIDVPDIFYHKLSKEKMHEFLDFHCRMKYEPACEKLRKLQTGKP